MELTAIELRILGCLVEKETTTPDNYPLSTNSLVAACNQRTNREPVTDFSEREVDVAMLELRTAGLARTVTGGRTNKHRHVLDEKWRLSRAQLAALAVLMLRGAQTGGEVRTRTERMHDFDSVEAVVAALESLAALDPPMVVHLDRHPGQKERRWKHLIGSESEPLEAPRMVLSDAPSSPRPGAESREIQADERASLSVRVDALERDIARLYALLGENQPSLGDAGDLP